jgi:hypothetical protein
MPRQRGGAPPREAGGCECAFACRDAGNAGPAVGLGGVAPRGPPQQQQRPTKRRIPHSRSSLASSFGHARPVFPPPPPSPAAALLSFDPSSRSFPPFRSSAPHPLMRFRPPHGCTRAAPLRAPHRHGRRPPAPPHATPPCTDASRWRRGRTRRRGACRRPCSELPGGSRVMRHLQRRRLAGGKGVGRGVAPVWAADRAARARRRRLKPAAPRREPPDPLPRDPTPRPARRFPETLRVPTIDTSPSRGRCEAGDRFRHPAKARRSPAPDPASHAARAGSSQT